MVAEEQETVAVKVARTAMQLAMLVEEYNDEGEEGGEKDFFTRQCSATRLQCHWRGYSAKKRVSTLKAHEILSFAQNVTLYLFEFCGCGEMRQRFPYLLAIFIRTPAAR